MSEVKLQGRDSPERMFGRVLLRRMAATSRSPDRRPRRRLLRSRLALFLEEDTRGLGVGEFGVGISQDVPV
jgi:hypothetical protein